MKKKLVSRFILTLSLLAVSACDREWTSPYDANYKLNPPTLLSVEPLNDTSIRITWKNNEDFAKGFVIQKKVDSGDYIEIETVDANILTIIDTTCELGAEYTYLIRSKIETNVSANSNMLPGATSFPAPSALGVNIISDNEVLVTWVDNCDFEDGYRLERDEGNGFTHLAELNTDITAFADSSLLYGINYTYRVAGYTENNISTWLVSDMTNTDFPAPTNLTAHAISDSEIELSWLDNCSFEDGFLVERDNGAGFIELYSVQANETSYIDNELDYGNFYSYRLWAYTINRNSEYSNTAAAFAIMPAIDFDGNVYPSVLIGDQVWMGKNLKVTHYRNGDAIPNLTSFDDWVNSSTSGALCYYENNYYSYSIYGALYNWAAVVDVKTIAPEGWHVPTDEEWKVLEIYLGMDTLSADATSWRGLDEGDKIKSTTGWIDDGGGTNSSSFNALPGGIRGGGSDSNLGYGGYFWSSTQSDHPDGAWPRILFSGYSQVLRYSYAKHQGLSVRCVRD